MIYYCDYEALERPRSVFKPELIPPWLQDERFENVQIPLVFTACTKKGNIAHSQDYYNNKVPISFLRFLDSIINFVNHKQHTIYFHNLYYDFNIILYELMWNNFTQYVAEGSKVKYEKLEELDKRVIDPERTFVVLGDNLKRATGVNIHYRGREFKIRDTFRIITSAQDKILESFGYEKKPPIDFDNFDVNDVNQIVELRQRCRYDVVSLAKCIEQFKAALQKSYNAKGDTAASIALSAVKEMLGEDFKVLYPTIAGTEFEKISRMAYNGGICQHTYHCEPGIMHENISYIDINSSYPYTHSLDVPYGIPEETDTFVETYSEYLVYVEFDLIEPNIPCVRCSSASQVRIHYDLESCTYHKRDEFPHHFCGYLALTCYDIMLLRKYYNIVEFEIIKGYKYKTAPIFSKFITELYSRKYLYKRQKNKVMELAIKILLNSLYGKFAQDLTGFTEFYTKEGRLKLFGTDLEKIYCPLSSYIVSAARYNWATVVNYDPLNFIYGDTDSAMVYDRDRLPPDIIGNELGKWAYEFDGKTIDKCKILGKKNYLLEVEGKQYLKCVGLPNDRTRIFNAEKYEKDGTLEREIIDFSNFEIGYTFIIQKMHKVYGGIAMHHTPFTLKERAVYRL